MRVKIEIIITKLMQNQREGPDRNFAKSSKARQNYGNLKSKTITFTPDLSVSVSTYSQRKNAKPNPVETDHLYASQNIYLRIQSSKYALRLLLTVLRPHGHVDK
jgi:hypothetical protein